MKSEHSIFIKRKRNIFMLLLSILVFTFWLTGREINIYRFPLVGAISELLWLPAIALTLALPVMAFLTWRKEHFDIRSLNLYVLLVVVIAIVLLIFNV